MPLQLSIQVVQDDKPVAQYTFDARNERLVKLGTRPGDQISIRDPSVRHVRARIVLGTSEATFIDLGTSGGVRINDKSVREAQLSIHDVIRIGRTRLLVTGCRQVQDAAPVEMPAPAPAAHAAPARAPGNEPAHGGEAQRRLLEKMSGLDPLAAAQAEAFIDGLSYRQGAAAGPTRPAPKPTQPEAARFTTPWEETGTPAARILDFSAGAPLPVLPSLSPTPSPPPPPPDVAATGGPGEAGDAADGEPSGMRREKYDTNYLAEAMRSEARRRRLLVGALIALVLAGVALAIALRKGTTPAAAGTSATPIAADAGAEARASDGDAMTSSANAGGASAGDASMDGVNPDRANPGDASSGGANPDASADGANPGSAGDASTGGASTGGASTGASAGGANANGASAASANANGASAASANANGAGAASANANGAGRASTGGDIEREPRASPAPIPSTEPAHDAAPAGGATGPAAEPVEDEAPAIPAPEPDP